jgi:hypothetical protein
MNRILLNQFANDLGIILSCNRYIHSHGDYIFCQRLQKTLGLVRYSAFSSSPLYSALLRSKLQLGSVVWKSIIFIDSVKHERIQR